MIPTLQIVKVSKDTQKILDIVALTDEFYAPLILDALDKKLGQVFRKYYFQIQPIPQ